MLAYIVYILLYVPRQNKHTLLKEVGTFQSPPKDGGRQLCFCLCVFENKSSRYSSKLSQSNSRRPLKLVNRRLTRSAKMFCGSSWESLLAYTLTVHIHTSCYCTVCRKRLSFSLNIFSVRVGWCSFPLSERRETPWTGCKSPSLGHVETNKTNNLHSCPHLVTI